MSGERLAEWLSRLVRIPSVNPAHAGLRGGAGGEAAIGKAVAQWFGELGGEVILHEVLPGRTNVYGIWPGRSERWAGVARPAMIVADVAPAPAKPPALGMTPAMIRQEFLGASRA